MARDTNYWLRRSEQEAIAAIQATHAGAAAIHQEMCLLYTGQALGKLVTRQPPATR